jgi:hypothetical protein
MTEEDDLENEEKEMEISLFKPAGPEIEKVIEELQMKKMSLSQAREVATRMVYGIHAQTEESGTRVMSRVRKIKRENLH